MIPSVGYLYKRGPVFRPQQGPMQVIVGANFSAKILRIVDWSSPLLNFLGGSGGSILEGSVSALCSINNFEAFSVLSNAEIRFLVLVSHFRLKHRDLSSHLHKRFWTGLLFIEGWFYIMGSPKKIVLAFSATGSFLKNPRVGFEPATSGRLQLD